MKPITLLEDVRLMEGLVDGLVSCISNSNPNIFNPSDPSSTALVLSDRERVYWDFNLQYLPCEVLSFEDLDEFEINYLIERLRTELRAHYGVEVNVWIMEMMGVSEYDLIISSKDIAEEIPIWYERFEGWKLY